MYYVLVIVFNLAIAEPIIVLVYEIQTKVSRLEKTPKNLLVIETGAKLREPPHRGLRS